MGGKVILLFLVLTRATPMGSSPAWEHHDRGLDVIPWFDNFFLRGSRIIDRPRNFVQKDSPHPSSARQMEISRCSQRSCGGQQNPALWQKVNENYGGLFFSSGDINNMNIIQRRTFQQPHYKYESNEYSAGAKKEESSAFEGVGFAKVSDFDQCCETQREFRNFSGIMTDVSNNQCIVISVSGKYQVANVGTCNGKVGGCNGTCRQEEGFTNFLCVTLSGQLQFRLFKVNSYCSCKAN